MKRITEKFVIFSLVDNAFLIILFECMKDCE
jgi:hypothetical protein